MSNLLPTWEEIAVNYPYAPGRGGLSDAEWKEFRDHTKKTRAELRQNKRDRKEFMRIAEKSDKAWQEALKADSAMITDRSQLPGRNKDQLAQGGLTTSPLTNMGITGSYLIDAYNKPQTPGEFAISWAGHTGEEVGNVINYLTNMLLGGDDEEEANFKPWLEQYLASGGGGPGGSIGIGNEAAGVPFPDINLGLNLAALDAAAKNIKAPEYKEQAYNPWDVIAAGLANADFSGDIPNFAKAVNAMNEITQAKDRNRAEIANANEEARYKTDLLRLNHAMQMEELRNKNNYTKALVDLERWKSMQPRALGGNKLSWRDANGNLHFEAIDKNGEARTLGTNAAMADLASMSERQLKRLTPKKILDLAKKQSLLLNDNAAQVPYMQGYLLQANQLLGLQGEEE